MIPFLVPVQKIASIQEAAGDVDLLELYISRQFSEPKQQERRAMLLNVYRTGRLFLVLDGIDEAPKMTDLLVSPAAPWIPINFLCEARKRLPYISVPSSFDQIVLCEGLTKYI